MKLACEGEKEEEPGGVWPCWILRIKLIGAFGVASAREKRPEEAVAEGGNGCWGWTFVRRSEPARWGT